MMVMTSTMSVEWNGMDEREDGRVERKQVVWTEGRREKKQMLVE